MPSPAAAEEARPGSGDLRRKPSDVHLKAPPRTRGPKESVAKAIPQGTFCLEMEVGDADDWVYKSEGSTNFILSYTGSSPSMLGKVLRAKKILVNEEQPAPNCEVFSSSEQRVWGELIDSVKQDCLPQAYAKLMSQRLGANHVDVGVLVRVSKEFLQVIGKNVLRFCPAWGGRARAIDTSADSALLMSDHSLFSGKPSGSSCIAVEIKAKCGFLPSSEYISKENSVKKQVTRYKMHQQLKFRQGQVLKTSDYDPLDLFSGSKEKISTAIKSFFSTPQNNFRIFVNGSLCFGAMGGGADTVHPIEPEKCLENLSKVSGLQQTDFVELISDAILNSGAMDALLATQKLDDRDIEGVIHHYYSILQRPCLICKKITDRYILDKYSSLHSVSLEESCMIVRNFLFAATAKDCSLMMCFRARDCETTDSEYNSVFLKSVNQTYDYKAYFVDLDFKPLDKMAHYFRLDQKIVNFYSRNGEAGLVPCDSPKGGGTGTSRVPLPHKGARRGGNKGVKKGIKGKDAPKSSASWEEQEREMQEEENSLMRKLPRLITEGDPHEIYVGKARLIAAVRSKFQLQLQFSIESLPVFKLNVECSVEDFERFLEERNFRSQLITSLKLVEGLVATPPSNHITFQLIELVESLENGDEKSIMQFVVCEFNRYVGGFRPTPPNPHEPDGFFVFDNMEIPLPRWFGKVFILKGHSESYSALTSVQFRAGLLRVMATKLLSSVTKENYMRRNMARVPHLEAPMVLFGEGHRSREVLESAVGTRDGPFGELLTAPIGTQLRVQMSGATDMLAHNWSSLSKLGLWFYVAVVELRMGLLVEARVSFRKARKFMRDNIKKMRQEGLRKVDLVLKDTDGVFSLKRLLGHYVTVVNYDEETVLRSIIREKLNFTSVYDRCGEARNFKTEEPMEEWDLTNPEHFDDHQEWQRWLRIKESNQDLLKALMV